MKDCGDDVSLLLTIVLVLLFMCFVSSRTVSLNLDLCLGGRTSLGAGGGMRR